MSRQKLMSREEKRRRLLEILTEGQEFYSLKDLEKMAKYKGMMQNQVKDILQELLDDALVDSIKIGSSLFYWSFPNKTQKTKLQKRDELRDETSKLNDELVTLEEALKGDQVGVLANKQLQHFSHIAQSPHTQEAQNDSDKLKRDQLTNEVAELEMREKDLSAFIKQNGESDRAKADLLKTGNKVCVLICRLVGQ